MILGSRSRNSGHFPKLTVKTVEIPDESVNDDLFPLFLSFHGLNLKHATNVEDDAEPHNEEDSEGGDAGEEDDAMSDDGNGDDDMFDIVQGNGFLNAHTRPHVGSVW